MKRELLMTKKPTSWLARVRTLRFFLSYLLPFFFSSRVDFPVWTRNGRGGQGPREDEVPATEQTLLPNLKILISVVVRSHSSSIWRTCVGGMGRVEIPTKYNISCVVWRGGWLWIMESSPRGKKTKTTKNGKGKPGNVYQHI